MTGKPVAGGSALGLDPAPGPVEGLDVAVGLGVALGLIGSVVLGAGTSGVGVGLCDSLGLAVGLMLGLGLVLGEEGTVGLEGAAGAGAWSC